jgi:hypothetical protein
MNSNVLKKIKINRMNREIYENIRINIFNKLKDKIQLSSFAEEPDKEDFGNIDILYINNSFININQEIIKIFNPIEITKNSNIISYSYEYEKNYYQINMIKVPLDKLNTYQFYMSYGRFGEILGILCKKVKLTFGHEGLWIYIDNIQQKIELSNDPYEICNFLGLDYYTWLIGFETNNDIFNFIKSSIIFSSDRIIQNKNNNKFINDFILSCSSNDINIDLTNNLQQEAIIYFNKNQYVQSIINEYNNNNKLHEKFNEFIIKEILENNHLDITMLSIYKKQFENHMNSIHNIDFRIKFSKNIICELFKDFLVKYLHLKKIKLI